MNIQELYQSIDGDYEQAARILRIDKLIDKHIRRLAENDIFDRLDKAAEAMDGNELFESSHAIKGVCGNLGLVKLSDMAAVISDEFRPGNERKFTDEEVKAKIAEIDELYQKTIEMINRYIEGQ